MIEKKIIAFLMTSEGRFLFQVKVCVLVLELLRFGVEDYHANQTTNYMFCTTSYSDVGVDAVKLVLFKRTIIN